VIWKDFGAFAYVSMGLVYHADEILEFVKACIVEKFSSALLIVHTCHPSSMCTCMCIALFMSPSLKRQEWPIIQFKGSWAGEYEGLVCRPYAGEWNEVYYIVILHSKYGPLNLRINGCYHWPRHIACNATPSTRQ
jgi:hypothetical protein